MSIFANGVIDLLASLNDPLAWFDEASLFGLSQIYTDAACWGRAVTMARKLGIDTSALEKAVRAYVVKYDTTIPAREDIADLMKEKRVKPKFLVDDLLPMSGLSVLAGGPKAGKSTLARYLMTCIVNDKPALGRRVDHGKCLYYVLEEKRDEIIDDFRRRGVVRDVYIRVGRLPRGGFVRILQEDVNETGAKFVLADPMFAMLGADDANDYVVMSREMLDIVYAIRDMPIHLMFVHHANKSGVKTAASILGSRAIEGSTDTNLILERREDGRRVLYSTQRYGVEIPSSFVELDKDTTEIRLRARGI